MTESSKNNSEKSAVGRLLEVPFAEKDQAKALGAKWNPEAKKWFVPEGIDQGKFSKWIRE